MKTEEYEKISLKVAALVEKARDGSRGSFQELVHVFQDDIYRLAYYRTFSQMDAEDLVQDVFEQAYRKINSLHDPERFRAWLYTIAVNRCNDFLRKRKYLALLQMRTAQEQDVMDNGRSMNTGYNEKIAKKRFWRQVKAILHKLSTMERQVFTLRFMDHLNINEIAAVLDKSESTIKTHLYRALHKVRGDAEFFREYRESIT